MSTVIVNAPAQDVVDPDYVEGTISRQLRLPASLSHRWDRFCEARIAGTRGKHKTLVTLVTLAVEGKLLNIDGSPIAGND